jgi:hypothetical protein
LGGTFDAVPGYGCLLDRDYRAKVLAASPYSIDELTQILASEVYPVCRWNLFSFAGEWAGFDPEWLEKKLLRRLSRRFRLKGGWTLGRVTLHLSLEWKNTRSAVNAMREDVSVSDKTGSTRNELILGESCTRG